MFAYVRTSKFEGFTGIEPLTFDLFSTSDPRANDLVTGRRFFTYLKLALIIFRSNQKRELTFFFCSPQQWTREGVRLASNLL